MAKPILTLARARELLNYDPITGAMTWRVSIGAVKAGDPIKGGGKRVYLRVRIDGTHYFAHRVAWLLHHGKWPGPRLDHWNRVKSDNRIDNLREISAKGNQENRGDAQSNNTLGVLGVSPSRGRFVAQICTGGKQQNLGRFDTVEEASAAYVAAKRQLHEACTL